jgi:hypothetical protein
MSDNAAFIIVIGILAIAFTGEPDLVDTLRRFSSHQAAWCCVFPGHDFNPYWSNSTQVAVISTIAPLIRA